MTPRSLLLPVLAVLAVKASAATVADVQSPARPFSLDVASPVYVGGSDTAAATFMNNYLPGMRALVDVSLEEYSHKSDADLAAIAFDATKLKLTQATSVRAYFIGEGASYRNSLGYTVNGGGRPSSPGAELIFPNASDPGAVLSTNRDGIRDVDEPLLPGDFVELGTLAAGSQLDFFLIANGATGTPAGYWYTNPELNADKLVHIVALAYPGSPYLIIGFEDARAPGSDRDFNDLLFVIDIGTTNIGGLTSLNPLPAPEPTLAMGGLVAAISMLGASRRRKF